MPRKNQWPIYFATLEKSGNDKIAMKACGANRVRIAEWCDRYPAFNQRRNEALARGVKAKASRVAGRPAGRPCNVFPEPQRRELLAIYEESGSAELTGDLCGVCVASISRLRRRDPVFASAWLGARTRSAALASISEPWHIRHGKLAQLIAAGHATADAARAAGVSEHLARMIAARVGLTAAQAKPRPPRAANRFDRRPPREREAVRANDNVQRAAVLAELDGLSASDELRRLAKLLTPEQKAFIALLRDDGLSIDAACERTGRTPRQVTMWADANAYFAQAISD